MSCALKIFRPSRSLSMTSLRASTIKWKVWVKDANMVLVGGIELNQDGVDHFFHRNYGL